MHNSANRSTLILFLFLMCRYFYIPDQKVKYVLEEEQTSLICLTHSRAYANHVFFLGNRFKYRFPLYFKLFPIHWIDFKYVISCNINWAGIVYLKKTFRPKETKPSYLRVPNNIGNKSLTSLSSEWETFTRKMFNINCFGYQSTFWWYFLSSTFEC